MEKEIEKKEEIERAVKHIITTEKSISGIERNNTLSFIVDPKATKSRIKKEIEETYKTSVVSVRIVNLIDGRKKAYVRLRENGAAADIAAKLKVI